MFHNFNYNFIINFSKIIIYHFKPGYLILIGKALVMAYHGMEHITDLMVCMEHITALMVCMEDITALMVCMEHITAITL